MLAFGAFLLYARTWGHPFVSYDDGPYVYENLMVLRGLSTDGIYWALTTISPHNWHPITWLSHLADVSIFGVTPGPMHLVNAALHAANTCLVYIFLRRTTGSVGKSAFVAAIFAVHPIRVESVAWIAERKDLLCALFTTAGLVAYADYAGKGGARRYAAVLVIFAAALMSKAMAVTFPFLLLLLDIWPLGRLRIGTPGVEPFEGALSPTPHSRLLVEKIPFLLMAAAVSIVTVVAQRSAGAVSSVELIPATMRFANAAISYVSYLGKILWPFSDYAISYPYRFSSVSDIPVTSVTVATILLVSASAGAVVTIRRIPAIATGWFWFLGTLVPVIGIVQVGNQSMADRYAYLPAIGISIIMAWGAPALLRKASWRESLIPVVATAAVIATAIPAWRQVGYWRGNLELFGHAVSVTTKNWEAEKNYASALATAGRFDEAVRHYGEVLSRRPADPDTHYNLGLLYLERGRYAEARFHLGVYSMLKPNDPMGLGLYRRAVEGRVGG